MSDAGGLPDLPSKIPITPVSDRDVIWVPNPYDDTSLPSIGPINPWPDPEPQEQEPSTK
jgi:hypothetical protein